ncbi:hypothetical protein VMCG_07011 [Cytospora schulzeri]|uniref:F-box domain-containing protein n=1 Tax=Cytospora schulzeri TaxID=448051 RepID=A0A423W426_9PEZI|nr:hypothetical protein VMCG_07011 [Valsa malicola]
MAWSQRMAQTRERTSTPNSTEITREPFLENIPPELRFQILSSADLPTLKSLVRASPTYHTQYKTDRDFILQSCLEAELDGFHVDAYATLKSRVRNLGQRRSDENITEFLGTYRRWVSGPDPDVNIRLTSPGEVRWLSAFHLSVVLPLAGQFCEWTLANLRRAAVSSAQGISEESQAVTTGGLFMLNKSERIRVLRALYRYETYYHLFGRNKGRRIGWFRHSEITEVFFNIMEPWEAEELGCIDSFIRKRYTDIFNQVKADLHPDHPSFDGKRGRGDPEGSFELDDFWNDYMDGTISRGIKIAAHLLTIDDHDQLVAQTARFLTHRHNLDASLTRSLSTVAQFDRREDRDYTPNAKDNAEGVDALVFVGDSVPPRGPPLAWVLVWEGKYVNIYGEYVPEPLKNWGWVFWDECRLVDIGVKELIASQWEAAPELLEEVKSDYPWLDSLGGSETPS